MSVIIAGIRELARTLGCALHQTDDVVREERSARAALGRRGFFRAVGAVAAGVCMPLPVGPLSITPTAPGYWTAKAHNVLARASASGWIADDPEYLVNLYGQWVLVDFVEQSP